MGAAGLLTDDVEQAALTREELAARVEDCLARNRRAEARRLIERYPDVALEALRTASSEQARMGSLQTIARVFDEQCGRTDASHGWLAVLQLRAEHPERFVAYDGERARLASLLAGDRPKDPSKVTIPAPPTNPAGARLCIDCDQLDCDQLLAKVLIWAERPAEAATILREGVEVGRAVYPYQAVQLLLALSDARRRAGQEQEAIAAWEEAAELAASLLPPPHPVKDPILWEHLSALRPVTTPWPDVVARSFAHGGKEEQGTFRGQAPANSGGRHSPEAPPVWIHEALIWNEIGRWRLERGESQASLLAFKRAEGATQDNGAKEPLRVSQALALIQMGQQGPAQDVLIRLASVSSSAACRPALAMLGALKFQEGEVEQSLALLKKAVEEDRTGTWPERSQAEADLGLAYLTTGDDANGLYWLHAAQQDFEKENDRRGLVRCLENEAAYQDYLGKPTDASSIRQRKQQLEGE